MTYRSTASQSPAAARYPLIAALAIALAGSGLAACGADDEGPGGGTDARDVDAPQTPDASTIDAEGTPPYAGAMFLRGTFNNWETTNQLRFEGDDTYGVNVNLAVAIHEFKIAPTDWDDTLTFSADADLELTIDLDVEVPLTAAPGLDNNTVIDIAEAGLYRFQFRVAGGDTDAPLLLVTRP